jgi:hypothetical protein
VGGFLLVLLTYWPGLVSADGLEQLTQARTHVFTDWHPPLMSRVWSILDPVVPGPPGMLLLQNSMFWCGLALLVLAIGISTRLAWLPIAVIGLYPPIFSSLGTIWKDVAMGAALVLACALFARADRRRSAAALLCGAVSLLYADSLRYNAAAAVLPIAVWGASLASRHVHVHGLALACFLFGGMTVIVLAEDQFLVNGPHLYPVQQIMFHDLTAISVRTGQIVLPPEVLPVGGPLTVENLRCVYSPDSAVKALGMTTDSTCGFRLDRFTDPEQIAGLAVGWSLAVWSHPVDYLAHRLDVFSSEFTLGADRVCYPLQGRTDPNTLGVQSPETPLNAPALDLFSAFAYRTPLYAGWWYLALGGVLLAATFLLRGADVVPALAVGSSGLLYGLTELATSTGCDFRFHWWTIVATLILAVLVVNQLALTKGPRPELTR